MTRVCQFGTIWRGFIQARRRAVRPIACLSALLAAAAWIGAGQCLALESETTSPIPKPPGHAISSVTALVPPRALKSTPSTFEIYKYDNSQLGSRAPLLLIHGLLGEHHPLFRWHELAQYLSQDQAFQKRYKIYLARYNSRLSLKEMTQSFEVALRNQPRVDGLTIITVSMSGEIVRNAMKDPAVDQSISRVLTMGAFFRGSPLFCAEWMHETIRRRHPSPLSRFYRSAGYKLYFARHKNLLRDYRWDDVDGQVPTVAASAARADFEVGSNSAAPTQLPASARQACDNKFVVYAGYLHNRYTPHPHGAVRTFILSPVTFFGTTLPAHLGREHPMLRFINGLIAESVPGQPGDKSIIYPLNDGISPVASSLLLSDDFVAHSDLGGKKDIENMRMHSNASRARLFDNIDHLTFIERNRPFGSSEDVADVLSPTEKRRPMFAWILKDLLE